MFKQYTLLIKQYAALVVFPHSAIMCHLMEGTYSEQYTVRPPHTILYGYHTYIGYDGYAATSCPLRVTWPYVYPSFT